jgi:quercetin dioxygenase-like cupin family protein
MSPEKIEGPDPVIEALLLALAPMTPPDGLALKQRVLARVAAEPLMHTVPASEDGWAELIPKIHAKRVFTDGTAESWLVRLEPGARAPAHDHPAMEECIVLQGSVRYVGGTTLNAGDYEAVLPGAHHTELVSDTGALVFLRYAAPLDRYLQL